MSDLTDKHCKSAGEGLTLLERDQIHGLLRQLNGWELDARGTQISRKYQFRDYYHTIAFVNALAWIAHREDHHPDLEVYYNCCLVRYSTHAVSGLTENDFICAAKVDALL
jgi:4a-hydroxytetrahydrobiopterin dehydratase